MRFANEVSGIRTWMEVDCRQVFQEIEAKTEFLIPNEILDNEEKLVGFFNERISEVVENPEVFRQPFSYQSHYTGSKPHCIGGMVGGLAAGILGGMLLSEIMDGFDLDGFAEGAADTIGMDEDLLDMNEGGDFGDFGDFFDGGDE
ncbi:hypothetical protein ELQ35_15695 [Peribacillus cavernae]|uniref:Uncharacterized protein n=1 Tax=Peribacillus cavernae TaxID=1674310 RepID=A0A433HH25_9BACI|nr:hypothetical protein [Peribacillus cavernae]MDQ0221353.1 hypothetical protein [Peribacillus cavernae]RUQ27482.1 hypothetical protein ELQ35_15695 [Peribacillus cavernae]